MPLTDTTNWKEAADFLEHHTVSDLEIVRPAGRPDGVISRLVFRRGDGRWLLIDSLGVGGNVNLSIAGLPVDWPSDADELVVHDQRVTTAYPAVADRGELYGLWITLKDRRSMFINAGFYGALLSIGEPDDQLPARAPMRLTTRHEHLPAATKGDPLAAAIAEMSDRNRRRLADTTTIAGRYLLTTVKELIDILDELEPDDHAAVDIARLIRALRLLELGGHPRPRVSTIPYGLLVYAHLADGVPSEWMDHELWSACVDHRPRATVTVEQAALHLDDSRIAAIRMTDTTATIVLGDGRTVVVSDQHHLRVLWTADAMTDHLAAATDRDMLSVAFAGQAIQYAISSDGPEHRLELVLGDQGVAFGGGELRIDVIGAPAISHRTP